MLRSRIGLVIVAGTLAVGMVVGWLGVALAHCDSTHGPVIPEARAALENGDVRPLLKWVTKDNEAEIESAFALARAVRTQGAQAKALADQYFLETLVRLHRAGEGAPYTGIKSEPVDPIVAMADEALASGSPDTMIQAISGHLANVIRDKFAQAVATKRQSGSSIDAGRAYVAAYVDYVHYVEGVHAAIAAAGGHHAEGQPATGAHEH